MGEADLLMLAKKLELRELDIKKVMLSKIYSLEAPLNDIYSSRRPNSTDYDNRRDLIRIVNEIAKEIYGSNGECPVVEEFGSFVMDMFNAKSDLDLSINFSDKNRQASRDAKMRTLRKFAKKFFALEKRRHVTNVQPILTARVPVLKVTDCGTGIECDFSVGNLEGIAISRIVLMISAIDERFQKLSFLMKAWAKAHDINCSKDGTLNSLSLILLAAFHLQSREPPILPPFSAIFRDGSDPEAVKKNIPMFLNYGKENKESLAELFVTLLIKLLSVESLWTQGLCASTYEGSWIYKTWKNSINIEDFTDRSLNIARVVWSDKVTKIHLCVRQSLKQIRSFVFGKTDVVKFKELLFGTSPSTHKNSIGKINHCTIRQPILVDPTQRKRRRPTQGGSEVKKLKETSSFPLTSTSISVPSSSTLTSGDVSGTWGPPVSQFNRSFQVFGGLNPNHPETGSYDPACNLNFGSSSSGIAHPHQPYLPPVPLTAPIGSETSHDPNGTFPFHPSGFSQGLSAVDVGILGLLSHMLGQ